MPSRLIVKPAINFLSTEPDADLLVQVGAIIDALTGNPNFPGPTPSLAVVTDAREKLKVALVSASDGGKLLTLLKNAQRAELVGLVRQRASYVAGRCEGDLAMLLSSGFPIHKPTRHAIGDLPAPPIPTLKQGPTTGTLIAITKRPYGTKICTWVASLSESPDAIEQTQQTTGGRVQFTGLIPGRIYQVKVNVTGTAGASDWSGSTELMVI